MRGDDQINQTLQMYVLLLRNKQLFTRGIAHTNVRKKRSTLWGVYGCDVLGCDRAGRLWRIEAFQ